MSARPASGWAGEIASLRTALIVERIETAQGNMPSRPASART